MTRSNRIGNRILIFLIGLVSIGFGATLALPRFASSLSLVAPTVVAPSVVALWITLVVSIVVIVLSLVWIFSRGRGRTSDLLASKDDTGSTRISVHIASDLLSDALAHDRDISSVGSGAYRMRGHTVLSIRLVARKGANLPVLIANVAAAIDELDEVLEGRIPVLLQSCPNSVFGPFALAESRVKLKRKGRVMGAEDKIKNAAEDLIGKGKEAVGKVTENDKLIAEGKADQTKASVKKAGENVKDAFKG